MKIHQTAKFKINHVYSNIRTVQVHTDTLKCYTEIALVNRLA